MTVPSWDAKAFHRQRQTPERHPYRWMAAAVCILLAGAAAVTATVDDDKIGVCHASSDGYVLLHVDRNGFEHGHHRHHEGDFFTQGSDCGGDLVPEVAEVPEANETDDLAETNDTATLPDVPQNDTVESLPDESENATTTPDNSTIENETAPLPGDSWIRQRADQSSESVRLLLDFGNAGDGIAHNAMLKADLPNVGRTWAVSGDVDCVLDGNQLTCWLGDLEPGSSGAMMLSAYTDQMRCGDALTNTVSLFSDNDADARNDAASASIAADAC